MALHLTLSERFFVGVIEPFALPLISVSLAILLNLCMRSRTLSNSADPIVIGVPVAGAASSSCATN